MAEFPTTIEKRIAWLDELLVSNKKWLIALAVGAFVLKIFYVLESAGSLQILVPIMDAKYYDKTARDILAGNIVRREAFFMGPLYSYFLAALYGIFGRDFTVIRVVQAAGGSLTVVLTYLLGKRMFRPSIGLVAALLLLFYGTTTFYETQLLMMWLGALLNTLTLFVLTGIRPDARPRAYLLPGILLGVSALARANVLLFWPVAAAWILWVQKAPKRGTKAAVFTGAIVIAILPATIHNFVASRDFVPITSNAGINFYIGNSELATGIFYPPAGVDFVADVTTRNYVERLMGRDMSPSEVSKYWFDKSFAFIRANPGAELKLLLRKFGMYFNAYEVPQIESYDLTRPKYLSLRILFVNMWFLGAFGVLGLVFSLAGWRRFFLLQGYVLAFAASITIFFVTARYRSQTAPVLSLFAAYALLDCLPRYLTSVRKGVGAAALLCLILFLTQPRLFALDSNEVIFREHVHEARRASIMGEYRLALAEIDKAVDMLPEYHEGYIHRAIIHKEGKNLFKAIEDYSRALELRPDLPGAHYDLGQIFRQVNLKQQAIEQYKQAIEIDPLMIKAYNNLGITYAELRRFGEAVEYFEKVIELDPTYVKAYNNMGVLLAQNDRVDEAIVVFRRAIEYDDRYASSYNNLANAYISKKQIQPAIDAIERYLELVPNDGAARDRLEKLYVAAAHDSTAEEPDSSAAPGR